MRIFSIFQSVNGEVSQRGIGSMTTFIRAAGCTANCSYCDTLYAKDPMSGIEMDISLIMNTVSDFNCTYVTITGGEPLEQREELAKLVAALVENGYQVTIETNGLHSFSKLTRPWGNVTWVVDCKLGSGFQRLTEMQLTRTDYIKMVVGSLGQFIDMSETKNHLQSLGVKATFAFSPEWLKCHPNELVQWMKEYQHTDSVLNVQLHKIIGLVEAK
jgi:7-carboxy-7-deazaguanine synthase